MAQVLNDDLDREGVVVEKKVIPQQSRTSPLAVIVLIAFVITCAVVFFGGYIRMPAENASPAAAPSAPTTTTSP